MGPELGCHSCLSFHRNLNLPETTHKSTNMGLGIDSGFNSSWLHSRQYATTIQCHKGQHSEFPPMYKVSEQSGRAARMEQLWREFFSDPSQWWDNRFTKRSQEFPDFKHKTTYEGLWVDRWCNPPWVKAKISTMALDCAQFGGGLRSLVSNSFSGDLKVRQLCEDGQLKEALEMMKVMVQTNDKVPIGAYGCFLKECTRRKALAEGKQVHSLVAQTRHDSDVFLANNLIQMYSKCGSLIDAHNVFKKMPQRNVFSWTAIISAYFDTGQYEAAIDLFWKMLETGIAPDKVAIVVALKACGRISALEHGKQLHCLILKRGFESDVIVQTTLIDIYAKCGCLEDARRVFDNMSERHTVSWNVMIGGYARNGLGKEALLLYQQMKQGGVQPDKVTFVVALKACISVGALEQGKNLHSEIRKRGLESDVLVQSTLVDMYAQCECLQEIQRMFKSMSKQAAFSWNLMIGAYEQNGLAEEALSLYEQMKQEGVQPNKVTFVALLTVCASIAALEQGKQLHSLVINRGFASDVIIQSTLVDMYAKCGYLEYAHELFNNMSERSVVSWNVMINGYARNGQGKKALALYEHMNQEGVQPDKLSFAAVVKACASVAALEQGKHVHSLIMKRGFGSDLMLKNTLIDMYAKCGSLKDAHELFDKMSERDVVTWTAMISGYASNGLGWEGLTLFEQMRQEGVQPDEVTFAAIFKACVSITALEEGKHFHSLVVQKGFDSDVIVQNSLIDMYVKCGCLEDARELFNNQNEKNLVSWNAMIAGYEQNGFGRMALDLYEQMKQEGVQPDKVTFAVLLKACASTAALQEGKQLHSLIRRRGLESDVVIQITLIDMYAKCGRLEDAHQLFNCMRERSVVSWNVIIDGYAQTGLSKEALALFQQMIQEGVQPDNVTFVAILRACASVAAIEQGKHFHSLIIIKGFESDAIIQDALLDMYAKCGCLNDARDLFNKSKQNVSDWNKMITRYVQNGHGKDALALYEHMKQEHVEPNKFTFILLLTACASIASLDQGKQLHAFIQETTFLSDVMVQNTLIDMYSKCGCLEEACKLFNNMDSRDVVSWTVMIGGYAWNGLGKEALALYEGMKGENIKPDKVTFICILSACSHSGLVEEGCHIFYSMLQNEDVAPTPEHYACLVDLLGRAGCITEAKDFLKNMPIQPSSDAWMSLLGAARNHGHLQIGKHAFHHVAVLEPKNAAPYLMVMDIHAAAGRVDEVAKIGKEMKDRGLGKVF